VEEVYTRCRLRELGYPWDKVVCAWAAGPGLRFNGEEYKTPAERRREKAEGERLNKALANLGVASRRAADDLIFGGRVKVNGRRRPGALTRCRACAVPDGSSATDVITRGRPR